ncbi:CoA transferase [Streptomyces sp. LX-29]|uniref:CoA transferase n=1 Tax=Streptomyces sp. LX-29 TaxID=2900152 RepID=UPI00240DB1EE|nr:CoA transferase [Streptomyces sp. LX-29]WFB06777.1 CoA transferase [Streptomyces sp. LX-29]
MVKRSTHGTARAWAALGGDPALLDRIDYGGPAGTLPARLPARELARSTVAVCALAAAELAARRAGPGAAVPGVRVDDAAVATAFASERLLLIEGRAPTVFAPLSRYWRTADGWVRTHANYPHHRARLLAALGVTDHGGAGGAALVERVAADLAGRAAREVERTVYAAGGLAVAVRSPEQWAAHPQGAAVARHPVLTLERIGDAPAPRLGERGDRRAGASRTRPPAGAPRTGPPAGAPRPRLPAAGLRVLDLTRVLAGPVATRTLALLGADVLRVDAPRLPEAPDVHADTGFGKRSTVLDLGRRADRAAFEDLLATADVVVTGYRPGALDRYGLAPDALAERRPGLVIGQLSAWGGYGPWGGRRGFDSLVQAATGIATREAAADASEDRPGALPAQVLDHGTGYLLAAAVLRAVTEQLVTGGTWLARLALAQTAGWLLHGIPADPRPRPPARDTDEPRGASGHGVTPEAPAPGTPEAPGSGGAGRWLAEADGELGRLRHALSPVDFDGGPTRWAHPSLRWGTAPATWS